MEDLAAAIGNRGFGALLLIFSLPMTIPIGPPGLSTVLGVPLIAVAIQLALGRRQPWLPSWLGRRSIPGDGLARALARIEPPLARLERVLRPRLLPLTSTAGERVVGILCLVVAIALALPIPFTNAPLAFAICALALGLLERDGFALISGCILGVLGLSFIAGTLVALANALYGLG